MRMALNYSKYLSNPEENSRGPGDITGKFYEAITHELKTIVVHKRQV